MLLLVLRKMLNNRWMVLCLLLGSILAVAMVSSVPVYTDGILQRMLVRDLENYQSSSGNFPGRYYIKGDFNYKYEGKTRVRVYRLFDKKIRNEMIGRVGLPILTETCKVTLGHVAALPEVQREEKPVERYARLEAMEGLKDHVTITHGRMFDAQTPQEPFEVIASENAMQALDLRLDETYVLNDTTGREKQERKVKLVGIFTVKDTQDPYWFNDIGDLEKSLLMDFGLFGKTFVESESSMLTDVEWFYAFDYHKLTLGNISPILKAIQSQQKWFEGYAGVVDFKVPVSDILKQYGEREKQLRLMLWVLQVPVLLMLAFYIFMVSRMIIENEENEIAVMESRGASRRQIFTGYLLESLILSGIAFVLGLPLGLLLCSILGASNGFLEFVQRTALPLSINLPACLYALLALLLFMAAMLIPAVLASRMTIVQYKQKKARQGKAPAWRKYFMDILLLGIACYGLYRYNMQQKALALSGAKGTELSVDYLLFLISTIFVLGAGLVFLRVYPYIIRLVFWLGRKVWTPVFYASFIQVGRSGGKEQFLMLFIILALSTGIFSANAARTINRNTEDRIRYEVGADMTAMAHWESDQRPPIVSGPPQPGDPVVSPESIEPAHYNEPPFTPFTQLAGVETVTKVLRREDAYAQVGSQWVSNIYLMGIIPDEFARVAWFRNGLLPHHFYDYLNLMSEAPTAFLLSSSFKEKYGAREGDTISVKWGKQDYLEGTVYAFVDYWPTFNPNITEKGGKKPDLIVANLPYIQEKLALEPYEVWIKKKPGAESAQIYNDIKNKNLDIEQIKNAGLQVVEKKNDPMQQGTNGALTLGFIATMIISTMGFMIYWILSIRRRVLQFGIFRAMGLLLREVVGMLVCEQILISGTAILMGIIVGGIASSLFVPLLEVAYSSAEQVPPFKVIAEAGDYLKIYAVAVFMLLIGFAALGTLVSRIKINQAIKLGED